ncbi:hypothetical protein PYCCODRAFT_1370075, partial [Trametes coccinea BRFM310]
RVAHLYLSSRNVLGSGNHSFVYRAPLEVRLDPSSPARSRVRVAVKTADPVCGAHGMLWQEARMYNTFPKEFMEDTVRTVEVPRDIQRTEVIPAVVPKFFGFYVPVLPNGEVFRESHERSCGRYNDATCSVDWPTPILLVEECGNPIEPWYLEREQRYEIHNLWGRLHNLGFFHGSPYPRNMLVQPGPLSAPREQRSMDSPSFRIIDFGRGDTVLLGCRKHWIDDWIKEEKSRVKRELRL